MVGGSWHCLGALPAGEGLRGGTMLTEGPTRHPPLKAPEAFTTLASETHDDPRKGLASLGFHGKLGREGGDPRT